MTDNRSAIAGVVGGGIEITCILFEGAGTIRTGTYDQLGQKQTTITYATELAEGDIVALANDSDCTYGKTGGIPVVEKASNGEAFVVGQITGTPRQIVFPTAAGQCDTLANQLTYKAYRVARVKMFPFQTIMKASVRFNATDHGVITAGEAAKLKLNIAKTYTDHKLHLDVAANGGTGIIPLHYLGTNHVDGDFEDCLVGITALMTAITGAVGAGA